MRAWRIHTVEAIADAAAAAATTQADAIRPCQASSQEQYVPVLVPATVVPAVVKEPIIRFTADIGSSLASHARQVRESTTALVTAASAMVCGSCSGETDTGSIVVSLADLCANVVSEEDADEALGPATFHELNSSEDIPSLSRQQAGFGSFVQLPDGSGSGSLGAHASLAAEELASEWHRLKAIGRILLAWSRMARTGTRATQFRDVKRRTADQRPIRSTSLNPRECSGKQGLKGKQGQGKKASSRVVWA